MCVGVSSKYEGRHVSEWHLQLLIMIETLAKTLLVQLDIISLRHFRLQNIHPPQSSPRLFQHAASAPSLSRRRVSSPLAVFGEGVCADADCAGGVGRVFRLPQISKQKSFLLCISALAVASESPPRRDFLPSPSQTCFPAAHPQSLEGRLEAEGLFPSTLIR